MALLDSYYLKHWHGVGGGTTVGTRALFLLRSLGYYRIEVFGMDSCWMGDVHHAFAQHENESDKKYHVTMSPSGHPEIHRDFYCAPWHLQQLQDFLQLIRSNGQHFLLHMHGDGALAYALTSSADVQIIEEGVI
jgi:hypothetical protein